MDKQWAKNWQKFCKQWATELAGDCLLGKDSGRKVRSIRLAIFPKSCFLGPHVGQTLFGIVRLFG